MTNTIVLKNAKIIGTELMIENGWLEISDQKITKIICGSYKNDFDDNNVTVIDCCKQTLIPGFIDIHVHGGYGYSFTDFDNKLEKTINGFSQAVVKEGVTKYCAATVSLPKDKIDCFFNSIGLYFNKKQPQNQAQLVGTYLEGPFLSHEYKGAHDSKLLIPPNKDWVAKWIKDSNNMLKFVAFAVEIDNNLSNSNSFTNWLQSQNVIPSLAHSNATFNQVATAHDQGLNHVTHLYNGMSPFNHRNPGCVPAALFFDDIGCEIICDGVHINLDVLKLTYKIKGADHLLAVSDAMIAKGCPNGDYWLGPLAVTKINEKVVLKSDQKTIAGSVATLNLGFKNLLTITDNNWHDCIKMTSYNAAKQLKITDQTGDIKENLLADLILLNNDNDVVLTICQGTIAFNQLNNKN